MLSVSSKYATVCRGIPTTDGENKGYHSSYYKNFTAFAKLGQNPDDSNAETTERLSGTTLQSQGDNPETSAEV